MPHTKPHRGSSQTKRWDTPLDFIPWNECVKDLVSVWQATVLHLWKTFICLNNDNDKWEKIDY